MKFKKYKNHFSIQIGGVRGENFRFLFQFYKYKPHLRITINFNTDRLIKIFGYNTKVIEI